eukprot:1137043-Pelagomonas_calceolata.AAC.7
MQAFQKKSTRQAVAGCRNSSQTILGLYHKQAVELAQQVVIVSIKTCTKSGQDFRQGWSLNRKWARTPADLAQRSRLELAQKGARTEGGLNFSQVRIRIQYGYEVLEQWLKKRLYSTIDLALC